MLARAQEALEDARGIHARLSEDGEGARDSLVAGNHLVMVLALQNRSEIRRTTLIYLPSTHLQIFPSSSLTKAVELARGLVTTAVAAHGEGDVVSANCRNNLALVVKRTALHPATPEGDKQSLLEEAVAVYRQALAAKSAKLGADHPDTIVTMHNLAEALLSAGQEAAATEVQEGILELMGHDEAAGGERGREASARQQTVRDMLRRPGY